MEILFWIGFSLFVVLMLLLDMFVFHRKDREVKVKEALWWSFFWLGLAAAFNLLVYYWKGLDPALEFMTGYLVELSLSVDNLFVFLLIFKYFKVPGRYQHKVLFWGIAGAVVMRILFIIAGIALIKQFHFMVYILGLFLVVTSIKMLMQNDQDIEPEKRLLVRLVRKYIPILKGYHGGKLLLKRGKRYFATPLLLVLIAVETTDIIFAMDSIPAILAITKDPFIVYTSNIFAILGLRSLYFALAGVMQFFHYLHYGLSVILAFIGVKIFISGWYQIDIRLSLGIVALILITSVVLSLLIPKKQTA